MYLSYDMHHKTVSLEFVAIPIIQTHFFEVQEQVGDSYNFKGGSRSVTNVKVGQGYFKGGQGS